MWIEWLASDDDSEKWIRWLLTEWLHICFDARCQTTISILLHFIEIDKLINFIFLVIFAVAVFQRRQFTIAHTKCRTLFSHGFEYYSDITVLSWSRLKGNTIVFCFFLSLIFGPKRKRNEKLNSLCLVWLGCLLQTISNRSLTLYSQTWWPIAIITKTNRIYQNECSNNQPNRLSWRKFESKKCVFAHTKWKK